MWNTYIYMKPITTLEISEDQGIKSGINTPYIRSVYEGLDRNFSKQSDTNRQKPTNLDIQGKDADRKMMA